MAAVHDSALRILRDLARDPSQVAREWKASGRKVVGCRCLYVPEEVIRAAGMLPFPLYGTPEPVGVADSYFQSCTCEFVRNIFDRVLGGEMPFLDALVLANTCDIVRHLYDVWEAYVEKVPVYLLNNPQKLLTDANQAYYLEELRRHRRWVEELAGRAITDEQLRAAIDQYNETRTLLLRLYELRRGDRPPITGVEALDVCTAVSVLPRPRANELLRRLLQELEGREVEHRGGLRIMVTGSVIDHPALIEIVEQEGGIVVADDLCNTTRTFWHQVEPGGDPLAALYRYYNSRPLCACMHPVSARLQHVVGLVDHFRVQGVVNFTLKYCHAFLYEAPLFRKALEAHDVPTMVLEVGHDLSGHGQLRTRVQAFLEMIELGV
jgi:benzoyl-CoA reductase subunit C